MELTMVNPQRGNSGSIRVYLINSVFVLSYSKTSPAFWPLVFLWTRPITTFPLILVHYEPGFWPVDHDNRYTKIRRKPGAVRDL